METHVQIPLSKRKVVYGILNEKRKSDTVLLIVHGRPGTALDAPGLTASRFFPSKGISTFRVSLYFWKKGARKLMDSTTSQHGKDIDVVVGFLRKKYKKVFVAGHSWGGPSIWFSDMTQMDGIILWDPSSDMKKTNAYFSYYKPMNAYKSKSGWVDFIPKKMYDEAGKYSAVAMGEKLSSVQTPMKFIMAGKGVWVKDGKIVYDSLSAPKSFTVIAGAGHHFAEEESEAKLFKETLSWIRKNS